MEIIPNLTSGRGSFGNMPPHYKARPDGEWAAEFLNVLDTRKLGALRRDASGIVSLVGVVHRYTYEHPSELSDPIVHGYTIGSALGYMTLEMLIRRLTPAIDSWGYLTKEVPGVLGVQRARPVSQLRPLFEVFERTTRYRALQRNFRILNTLMVSREFDRNGEIEELDLYRRLEKGRNLLLHGNLTHSFESHLLVLLIDLILLHVMVSRVSKA